MGQIPQDKPVEPTQFPISETKTATTPSPEQTFGEIAISLDEMSVAVNGDDKVVPPIPSSIDENNFNSPKVQSLLNNWSNALSQKIEQLPNNESSQSLIDDLKNLNTLVKTNDFSSFKNQLDNSHGNLESTFTTTFSKTISPASTYDKGDVQWNAWLDDLKTLKLPPGPVESVKPTTPPIPTTPTTPIVDENYINSQKSEIKNKSVEILSKLDSFKKDHLKINLNYAVESRNQVISSIDELTKTASSFQSTLENSTYPEKDKILADLGLKDIMTKSDDLKNAIKSNFPDDYNYDSDPVDVKLNLFNQLPFKDLNYLISKFPGPAESSIRPTSSPPDDRVLTDHMKPINDMFVATQKSFAKIQDDFKKYSASQPGEERMWAKTIGDDVEAYNTLSNNLKEEIISVKNLIVDIKNKNVGDYLDQSSKKIMNNVEDQNGNLTPLNDLLDSLDFSQFNLNTYKNNLDYFNNDSINYQFNKVEKSVNEIFPPSMSPDMLSDAFQKYCDDSKQSLLTNTRNSLADINNYANDHDLFIAYRKVSAMFGDNGPLKAKINEYAGRLKGYIPDQTANISDVNTAITAVYNWVNLDYYDFSSDGTTEYTNLINAINKLPGKAT